MGQESKFQEEEALAGFLFLSWAALLSSQLLQSFLLIALFLASSVKATLPLISPRYRFSSSLFSSFVSAVEVAPGLLAVGATIFSTSALSWLPRYPTQFVT